MAPLLRSSVKEQLNCVKDGFSFKNSDQLSLLIETGPEGFRYALLDPRSMELLAIQDYTFQAADRTGLMNCLSELETKLEIFRHEFKQVLITWKDNLFTLVPNALYKPEQKEAFLQFNHSIPSMADIMADEIKAAESRCVYAVAKEAKSFFDTHFPNHRLKHYSTVHIEDSFSSVNRREKQAIISLGQSMLNIAILDKQLCFYNVFQYQSSEDLLYFILLSMEQNGCDPQLTEVYLCGETESGSGVHKILKQYIKQLNFLVGDKRIVRGETFHAVPHHFYYHLIQRILCA